MGQSVRRHGPSSSRGRMAAEGYSLRMMVMDADNEITNRELARRLESFALDVRGDLAEITRRLDLYVLREVYAAEQKATETRISNLERRWHDADEQRRSDRRWLIAGVILPLMSLLAMVLIGVIQGVVQSS